MRYSGRNGTCSAVHEPAVRVGVRRAWLCLTYGVSVQVRPGPAPTSLRTRRQSAPTPERQREADWRLTMELAHCRERRGTMTVAPVMDVPSTWAEMFDEMRRRADNTDERTGQADCNALAGGWPEVAEGFRGSLLDPFHVDGHDPPRVQQFLLAVSEWFC